MYYHISDSNNMSNKIASPPPPPIEEKKLQSSPSSTPQQHLLRSQHQQQRGEDKLLQGSLKILHENNPINDVDLNNDIDLQIRDSNSDEDGGGQHSFNVSGHRRPARRSNNNTMTRSNNDKVSSIPIATQHQQSTKKPSWNIGTDWDNMLDESFTSQASLYHVLDELDLSNRSEEEGEGGGKKGKNINMTASGVFPIVVANFMQEIESAGAGGGLSSANNVDNGRGASNDRSESGGTPTLTESGETRTERSDSETTTNSKGWRRTERSESEATSSSSDSNNKNRRGRYSLSLDQRLSLDGDSDKLLEGFKSSPLRRGRGIGMMKQWSSERTLPTRGLGGALEKQKSSSRSFKRSVQDTIQYDEDSIFGMRDNNYRREDDPLDWKNEV